MNAKYAVLLGLVVIDATTNAIRFREGATTETVSITPGVYFVRGNAGATDLLAALVTALESNSNATNPNTYEATITFDTALDEATAEVSITRASGTSSFSILWADALTTFVPALLGFAAADSAHDGAAKVSTLSPSSLWVASSIVNKLEPKPVSMRSQQVSRGNVARTAARSRRRERLWEQSLIHAKRMHEEDNQADPTATFGRFLDRHEDGKRFEFHLAELATGTTLGALSAIAFDPNDEESGTRVGTFIFKDDFYPGDNADFAVRDSGCPMFSFRGRLLAYHVVDVDEELPAELIADAMTLHLDASDDDSFDDVFGDPITIWRDLSGNSRHADSDEHTNTSARPKRVDNVQNGLPGVRFGDGGVKAIAIATGNTLDIMPAAGFTTYTVIKPITINDVGTGTAERDNDVVWIHGNGGRGMRLRATTTASTPPFYARTVNGDGAGAVHIAQAVLATETDAVVVTSRLSGTTLGCQVDSNTEVTAVSASDANGSYNLCFGAEADSPFTGQNYYRGYLLEIACYAAEHTPEQVAHNIAVLTEKWAIS